jgi:7,8-dihydropterin-6-yl-methyl-4-(beta-D-ribofuranosyl)aminobenzene 5'-phosphate synthase
MKLTLIAEGSTKWQRLTRHWGISCILGDDVLFDTFGRADIFRRNIKKLRIDIQRIKHVVISHDDWDHINGLEWLLSQNSQVSVYLCKGSNKKLKDMVLRSGAIWAEVEDSRKITDTVFSLGQMPAYTGRGLLYEQAIALRTPNGIAVITGCAHPDIFSIVKQAGAQFHQKIYAVCGGFHMKDRNDADNKRTIQELKNFGIQKIMPMHCTGKRACSFFSRYFGENCIGLSEGEAVDL